MQLDHPMLRADCRCPVCLLRKEPGLVTCWSCYDKHGLRSGNEEIERILDRREATLAYNAQFGGWRGEMASRGKGPPI